MKTKWIVVYRSTIEPDFDGDNNLSEIQVSMEILEKYFEEKKDKTTWKTLEEFLDNYIADDTEDFYEYAKSYDAIMDIQHW